MDRQQELLHEIKQRLPELRKLLHEAEGWLAEDLFYRYYHGSFKVYGIQSLTTRIVSELRSLSPHEEGLNEDFLQIIAEGTGKTFQIEHNQRWAKETRPMLEAFFHAREMLRYVVEYGSKLQERQSVLDSGWAAVLYLYNMR